MGSYWSSEDPRIPLLEARIAALEQSKPGAAPTLPRRTKPVVMPQWHGKLMEEISKRRQSMRLASESRGGSRIGDPHAAGVNK